MACYYKFYTFTSFSVITLNLYKRSVIKSVVRPKDRWEEEDSVVRFKLKSIMLDLSIKIIGCLHYT